MARWREQNGSDSFYGPTCRNCAAVLDACVTALDQYGTKVTRRGWAAAIELADGFPIDECACNISNSRADLFPVGRRETHFPAQWRSTKGWRHFVQADLARTLRAIVAAEKTGAAKVGMRDFWRHAIFLPGPDRRRIGDYMQQNGGLLAAEDLALSCRVGSPVKADYHGYEIYKAGF